jgi:hypothetical protein
MRCSRWSPPRPCQGQGARLLPRHAPAPGDRGGPAAEPAPADPRRAHDGARPGGMRDMRELVLDLAARGITVLLSSHLLVEVDELCNRVAIVRKGSIAYEGSLAELRQTAGLSYLVRTTDDERAREILSRQPKRPSHRGRRVRRALLQGRRRTERRRLFARPRRGGHRGSRAESQACDVEELFFRLTEDGASPAPDAAEPAEAPVAADAQRVRHLPVGAEKAPRAEAAPTWASARRPSSPSSSSSALVTQGGEPRTSCSTATSTTRGSRYRWSCCCSASIVDVSADHRAGRRRQIVAAEGPPRHA